MKVKQDKPKHIQFIRELCKLRSEEEISEAEENFREYILVIKAICDRIEGQNHHDDLEV